MQNPEEAYKKYEEHMKTVNPLLYADKHFDIKLRKWVSDKPKPKPKPKPKKKRKKKYKLSDDVKEKVLERDDYKCIICQSTKILHLHHVIYRSEGGKDEEDNLVTLCKKCHKDQHKNEKVARIL